MSWFDPKPPDLPFRLPKRTPKRIVPSMIGEDGQVLNLLQHHGAGAEVRDYSQYDNHGNIVGPVWVEGSYGWALQYAGAEYVNCGLAASLMLTSVGSIYLWFYPTAYGTTALLSTGNLSTDRDGYTVFLEIFPSRRIGLHLADAAGFQLVWTTSQYSLNVWHCFEAVWDGSWVNLYLDGVLDTGPVAQTRDALPINNLNIGRVPVGTSYNFSGIIASPRIRDVASSGAEAVYHFQSTRSIFGV